MSLLLYISQRGFPPDIQRILTDWYEGFDGVARWEFIRRNIDRECVRQDIDTQVWDEFLREVADICSKVPPSNPLDPIKAAIDNHSPKPFFLPGLPFAPLPAPVYRYMLLEHFMRFNYRGRIQTRRLPALKTLIDQGLIDGSNLEGTTFGKRVAGRDFAVWFSDASLANVNSGETARDRLGLHHVHGGYLLEVSYPLELLEVRREKTAPPTVIDGLGENSDNWIWIKTRNPGGPGWGYSVDMSGGGAGAVGVPEAVHAPVEIAEGDGARIRIRALEPFASTAPQMDHAAMLQNENL